MASWRGPGQVAGELKVKGTSFFFVAVELGPRDASGCRADARIPTSSRLGSAPQFQQRGLLGACRRHGCGPAPRSSVVAGVALEIALDRGSGGHRRRPRGGQKMLQRQAMIAWSGGRFADQGSERLVTGGFGGFGGGAQGGGMAPRQAQSGQRSWRRGSSTPRIRSRKRSRLAGSRGLPGTM